jgi:hypothetical protein
MTEEQAERLIQLLGVIANQLIQRNEYGEPKNELAEEYQQEIVELTKLDGKYIEFLKEVSK